MATNQPEDHDSPSSVSAARKSKLGYTRTSVACEHCRKRKIRCIREDADSDGRCANCIKLKRECKFTAIDSSFAESKSKLKRASSSQGSSAVSQSPAGQRQDRFDIRDHNPSDYAAPDPSDLASLQDMSRFEAYQGTLLGANAARSHNPDAAQMTSPNWQSSPVGIFQNQPSPQEWQAAADQLRSFAPPNTGLMPSNARDFPQYGQVPPVPIDSWTSGAPSVMPLPQSYLGQDPLVLQRQQEIHQQQVMYAANYGRASPLPTVNTPFPHPYQSAGMSTTSYASAGGFPALAQQPSFDLSRHDSMATNWSRGTSQSASFEQSSQTAPYSRFKHPAGRGG